MYKPNSEREYHFLYLTLCKGCVQFLNVILTDMRSGREVARFNSYGIGAAIRDHYRILCEKMNYDTFLGFIEKEVALHQQYGI